MRRQLHLELSQCFFIRDAEHILGESFQFDKTTVIAKIMIPVYDK